MTPKSLLRHKRAVSRLDDFGRGTVVPPRAVGPCRSAAERDGQAGRRRRDQARRALHPARSITTSGRAREARHDDIQILRLEQLYPFPANVLAQELTRFPKAEIVWCQEEPKNQGAWTSSTRPAMGARPDRRQARPPALCRPAGLCLHRGRPDDPAPGAAQAFLDEALKQPVRTETHDRAERLQDRH